MSFDIDTAVAKVVAEHGLSANLARMAINEDPAVQAQNIRELKAALGAKQDEDKAKAAKIEKLKAAYADARDRRDVQEMIHCKFRLGELGVFRW
ncbi:MAG: hypothetical protein KKC30_10570 [Proteobacteria bacterium]|nr:hypothetical protein [Pseudomonadota bacterium]MBU4385340.1 hypothetical protein [Pseudomonadota bacterium]MCG2764530.1 hypothetical protein [Desulfarculaceae bacterium]